MSLVFREDLYQLQPGLGGQLEPPPRVELDLAVKIVAAREKIGTRQALESQLRPIGSPANGFDLGTQSRTLGGFLREFDQLGEYIQNQDKEDQRLDQLEMFRGGAPL